MLYNGRMSSVENVEWSRPERLPSGKRSRTFRRISFRDGIAAFTPEEVDGMIREAADRGFGLGLSFWGFSAPDGRGYRSLDLDGVARLLKGAGFTRTSS